jgi:hypothetical protein
MKTLLVCDEATVNNHVGEEYDDIIEVVQVPTTENIKDWADRIKSRIRKLWNEDGEDKKVVITFDSSAPYKAVIINLRINWMNLEEKIDIELPGVDESEIPQGE